MEMIDTHCHIHDPEFFSLEEAERVLDEAIQAGVTKLICIATSLADSKRAIAFAQAHADNCWASIGIHPHEARNLTNYEIEAQLSELTSLAGHDKVVAVGECGFDFYYNDKKEHLARQEKLLRGQIEIAVNHSLPLSFHVREAYDEFWRVFGHYPGLRGVLHSFTDSLDNAKRALDHKLFIGVNGIATFTSHQWQKDIFQSLPLESIVVETDAPFLTPVPKRGTINTPKNVIYITDYLAELRGENAKSITKYTTANARNLFGF